MISRLLILILILFPGFSFADNTKVLINQFAKQNHVQNMSVAIVHNNKIRIITIGHEKYYAINSMTKSFAGLLLAYDVANNKVKLSTKMQTIFPKLRSTAFGQVTFLNLATHTTGLPFIQIPENISLIKYLRHWHPEYKMGTRRIYSNNNIAILGKALAEINHKTYSSLLQNTILTPFAMRNTLINASPWIHLPKNSIFIAADGIVSTAQEIGLFLQKLMFIIPSTKNMQSAIKLSLTGYYQTPNFTQGLSWQEYSWPIKQTVFVASATLTKLLDSPAKIIPTTDPNYQNKLILRTGSGHGFSSIMAFIPAKKVGVVLLLHKEVSAKERYQLIHQLLSQ